MSAYEPYPPQTPNPMGGPTPIAADALLASRWRRFFALCLDLLIAYGLATVLLIIVGIIVTSSDMTTQEQDDAGVAAVLLIFGTATLLYQFAYLPLLLAREGARNGQTLGKQALGVRVVTAEGFPVTYGRGLRRELLGTALIMYVIPLYFFIDYAFGLFDGRRQCLHDKIGSTYVLKEQIPFGDGRPPLPQNLPAAYAPAPPPYGQQPTPPYGQQPAPPSGHQPAPPYGQQPAPPYGQQPAPQEAPADEPLYPRAPDAGASPERPEAPASPLTARAETPQQSWSPPRRPGDDGNDAARRAFGDDR